METVDILRTIVWILMFLVSVPLNGLCLIALRYTNEIETSTKIFLASLTVSELFACTIYVLPAIVASITGVEPFTGVVCVLQYLVFNTCTQSIYTSLLAVNLERHIAVTFPLRYTSFVTASRARVTVLFIWILSFVNSLMFCIAGEWKADYDLGIQVCLPAQIKSFMYDFMTIYTLAFMNLVLLTIIVLFIKLKRLVNRQAARIAELTVPTTSGNSSNESRRSRSSSSNSNVQQQQQRLTISKRDVRVATTFFFMTLAVIFAVIPWEVSIMLLYSGMELPPTVLFIIGACSIAGGWIDVLVYYVRNRAIRSAAMRVLKGKCRH